MSQGLIVACPKASRPTQQLFFFYFLFFLKKKSVSLNGRGQRCVTRWESDKCPKQLSTGRMEIVYVCQKLRKDFGRAPKFTDFHADIVFEIMPNPEMMG
jgi:hypothetical protein